MAGHGHDDAASRAARMFFVNPHRHDPSSPLGSENVLRERLRSLTTALDDPSIDLYAHLATMLEQLAEAIPSLLAVRLSVIVDDYEFDVTAFAPIDDGTPADSTLLIPLRGASSDVTGANLLLFASSPGALVDLAADSAYLLGIDLAAAELDHHLDTTLAAPERTSSDAVTDLRALEAAEFTDRATIDYAIGILFEQGNHPTVADARAAVSDLAKQRGTTLANAAQHIVDTAIRAARPPD